MSRAIGDLAADPLAKVGILDCLDAEERARIARQCRLSRFQAGEYVIGEDRDGQEVVFVLEGRVRVVGRTVSGRMVTFAEIEAGGHVGELAAIDGGPRTADVEAVGDCRVAIMPPRAFRDMLEAHPRIAVAVLRNLARVIRAADLRISELSTMGAAERLARELLRRAQPLGADPQQLVVEPVPTQEHLASITGATRETVARLLGQLQNQGLTRRRGSRLTILNAELLRDLAEGERPSGWPKSTRPFT
jgi:CRP-like cAMP-binding protein